jgi:chitodextrinase
MLKSNLNLLLLAGLAALAGACQPPGDQGGAALSLRFEAPAGPTRGVLTGIVQTIRVSVYAGESRLKQAIFDYDDLQGTLGAIPAGSNRTFDVEALSGNELVYRGTATGITIEAGQVAQVPVLMTPAYAVDVYPPGQVNDLAGSEEGGGVRLTFTAVGNDGLVGQAAGYDLRRSEATIQAANFELATQVTGLAQPGPAGTAESLRVSGLEAGRTYHFALKVLDAAGNRSRMSNETIVQLAGGDTTPPGTVVDLAVIGTGPSSVSLLWTAPGDDGLAGTVAQYDLRYSTAPITAANFAQATSALGPAQPVAGGQTESAVVENLTPGQLYHFALRAADEVPNWSALSNVVQGTPGEVDTTPPAAVTDLAVTAVTFDGLTLRWTAPGDDGMTGTVSAYDLRRAAVPIADESIFQVATQIAWPGGIPRVSGGELQQLQVADLTPGQTYHFALKAVDDAGNWSGLSNTIEGTPADLVPPAAVVDLQAESLDDDSVILTWRAPADEGPTGRADRYEIRHSAASITPANFDQASLIALPPAPRAPGQAENLVVDGLVNLQEYHFALVSYDAADNRSALSNGASATPGLQDTTPPAAVVDLVVEGGTETSLTLGWTAPGDDGLIGAVSAYDLRWAAASIENETDFAAATLIAWPAGTPLVAGGLHQTVEVDGLSTDTAYHFALKAVDNSGNWSALSNPASGTPTDLVPPEAVTDLRIEDATDTTLELAWTAPHEDGAQGGAVASYEIRHSTAVIDAANFSQASLVASPPAPLAPGQTQDLSLTRPFLETTFVALISLDAAGNPSALSNVVSGYPGQQDVIPPGTITDLVAVDVGANLIELAWTAPHEDEATGGAVVEYDLRMDTQDITTDEQFDQAIRVTTGMPTPPALPGQTESVLIGSLEPSRDYYFSIKARDDSGNWSARPPSLLVTTLTK